MLVGRTTLRSLRCSHYSTRGQSALQSVATLPDAGLTTFQTQAFIPATPALLPKGTFNSVPAITKWFKPTKTSTTLNTPYLSRFGATLVPLEITLASQFSRTEQSLSFFLECIESSTSTRTLTTPSRYFTSYTPHARTPRNNNTFFNPSPTTTANPPTPTQSLARVYLAQAPIADLPRLLRDDLPIPEYVLKAGKGDVYDSSIWLGQAPTYTPLHRDPNPNLFVQLAGRKVVRLCRPEVGMGIFQEVQERIGGGGSDGRLRGEEMMQGREKEVLEGVVWGGEGSEEMWEARLESGDGLFIPKGWWHSVKGTGEGMTGSVNWWFR